MPWLCHARAAACRLKPCRCTCRSFRTRPSVPTTRHASWQPHQHHHAGRCRPPQRRPAMHRGTGSAEAGSVEGRDEKHCGRPSGCAWRWPEALQALAATQAVGIWCAPLLRSRRHRAQRRLAAAPPPHHQAAAPLLAHPPRPPPLQPLAKCNCCYRQHRRFRQVQLQGWRIAGGRRSWRWAAQQPGPGNQPEAGGSTGQYRPPERHGQQHEGSSAAWVRLSQGKC